MPEHRSHHRAEPEPPRRTAKDYAWIGAAITALGTMLGGHAYDRNSNLNESENTHKGVLSHVEAQLTILRFQIKRLEEDNKTMRRRLRSLRSRSSQPRAMRGDAEPPVSSGGWDDLPTAPEPPPPPPQRSKTDIFKMIQQKAQNGEVYQPPGSGYSH
ncbi:hypothetical protein LCGC14_0334710 [marine sediment metagenome]|uniref:Uncharacterized protein n=1 Tax=marine sediment metagenome TaxID=412755 RepID=A0A0F9WMV5_9ZZZZ